MNLYEVLGVDKRTTEAGIKRAYRILANQYHPDKVPGMENKFQEIQLAYKILSEPDRRERYNRTGRYDDIKVTPKVIQNMVETLVLAMVMVEDDHGNEPDDPTWSNVKEKMLGTIRTARADIQSKLRKSRKKLTRLEKMAKRFRSKTQADPIGDAFAVHRLRLTTEINTLEDGLELNYKTEEVFQQYDYQTGEVGPEPEGQVSPGPTARLSGPRLLLGSSVIG